MRGNRGKCGGTILAALVMALAVGCGGEDDPVGSEDTGGEITTSPTPNPGAPQGRAFREAKWIADSGVDQVLAEMRRDIRSFTARGRPASGIGFYDQRGPQYFCGRKLGKGGPPPTQRLVELRRNAREACDHLQRALVASLTFKAGENPGGDEAGAARAARQAREPAAKAQALLDAIRR